eukprot:NODE_1647_length_510_cov_102.865510_g1570_i0.p4 GENE.NODE_1647_length_510_cov_102.865510_g1570_i0~~NODE_1647_length_510_cov_102.865510_g1570_i0.p4  ORF type:complete len:55 (-),score=1.22 NODE_1647_length_510_cov_102.865510_g1570_i0:185-349(-)
MHSFFSVFLPVYMRCACVCLHDCMHEWTPTSPVALSGDDIVCQCKIFAGWLQCE